MNVLEQLAEKQLNRRNYMRSYMNTYYETHKETILQQQHDQKKRYRENNLEKVKSYQKEWYAKKKAEKLARSGKTEEIQILPALI